jgi:hypothetical protein
VRPESPETIRIIDDATVAFQPAFGRGTTQRGIFADPRWGLRRRYRGLRSDEKAAIQVALNETRGQFNVLRVTPHTPIRGSFATSELLSNNTFASGTSSWSESNAGVTLTAVDRVLRIRRADGANSTAIRNTVSMAVTANSPYVLRAFAVPGRGATGCGLRVGTTLGGIEVSESAVSATGGMLSLVAVPSASPVYASLVDSFSGRMAGDYTSYPYSSYSRCALVDNAANLLTRSDDFDHADWAKIGVVVGANTTPAPDGTSTMDGLIEDTNNTGHLVTQNKTGLSSAAADYTIAVEVTPGNRSYCFLQMDEGGSTVVTQFFNLASGVVGSSASTGAGWSNRRAAIVNLGDSRYYCVMTARKTSSATTVKAYIGAASADGTSTYVGNGAGTAIAIRRGGVSPSSVWCRMGQTTSAATVGAPESGGGLYTKGWPVSTNGLLLTGDWIEINGELKQLTAPVNSDAAGLAYIQFRPGLASTPADNDPVVAFEPFGRFIYPGTREFENLFGIYGDCEMNLEEIYS